MGYLTCDREFHRDFGGPRPKIVVLCGSTRFIDAFRNANLDETLAGRIVLSIGCDMRTDADLLADRTEADMAKVKAELDELHQRKIDLADEVLVLNVDGYIGESTRSEIAYAQALGKPIRYLESGQPAVPATDDEPDAPAGELLTTADPSAVPVRCAEAVRHRGKAGQGMDLNN